MDSRKRKPPTASSSTPTKKRSTTPRPAKRYRRVTESGGTRVSNVRTNGAKRLQDIKIVSVPNRRAGPGGYTIVATPRARIGDSGVIDGVRYVVRSEQELRSLIAQRKWSEVERTCTSRITNMRYMFSRTSRLRGFNFNLNMLNRWDTSRVTNMSYMFYNAFVFNDRIGAWDTSSVTDMRAMFYGARAFNRPVGEWNTSRVTDMGHMFRGASAFNQPIGAWDTTRVVSMSGMFSGTSAFNQSIGAWETTRVVSMNAMFYGARAFNQPIANWNISRVTDMSYMFYGARAFNRPVGEWNTSRVTDMGWMFSDTSAFNQPIAWDTSRVRDMSFMFYAARAFNQPIANWNISRVRDMTGMFDDANRFRQDLSPWATRLPNNVEIDRQTRDLIGTPPDPHVAAFRARRYRLHPEANAIDPVLLNRVNLDDAVVLAGDLHGDSKIRHVFSRATTEGIFRVGRAPKHPVTRTPIHPEQVVPLRDVLHANDVAIYNRVGTPAGTVQARTVKQVRESNARNARNARNINR
jgi:surface protein